VETNALSHSRAYRAVAAYGCRMAPQADFPGDNPHDDMAAYPGLERETAERRAREHGWTTVRSLPPGAVVTMEYVVGRLNFTIKDDRVQRAWFG